MIFVPPAVRGVDLAAMDRTVVVRSPADLYPFANGGWTAKTEIPEDRSFVGKMAEIMERNQDVLWRIGLREALAEKPLDTPGGMVGLMVRLGMDDERAERQGAKPLASEIARIEAAKDARGLLKAIAHLQSIGVSAGFEAGVGLDDRNAGRLVYALGQPELTMMDRELYLGTDAHAQSARARYVLTTGTFLRLAGLPKAGATDALSIETVLARAASTPVELRSPGANSHPMTLPELHALTPGVPWDAYFAEFGARPTAFNVAQPRVMKAFGRLVASRPLSAWRNFLRAQLLTEYAPTLSRAYNVGLFALQQTLTGQPMMVPRSYRAISTVDETLGDALGRLYVREAFSFEAKEKALDLVHNVVAALRERIGGLDWMSEPTKRAALAKLASVTVKVGYPERWKSYTGLRLADDSLAQNVMRARAFEWRRRLALLNRSVDRTQWWNYTPATANAAYNPLWNEIVLPAGILQPGLFDPEADDATNYGAIAAIMGHEIIHGFDDQGSQYDAQGLRRNWWTAEDRKRFEAKLQTIVAQYGGYRSPGGLPVNSRLTVGENVADIGGLAVAYAAYRKSLNGVEPPVQDGLTGDQRFFVSFAQNWRAKYRPETERTFLSIDTHAPAEVRAMGAVADLPAFYRAFGLPVPDKLPGVW